MLKSISSLVHCLIERDISPRKYRHSPFDPSTKMAVAMQSSTAPPNIVPIINGTESDIPLSAACEVGDGSRWTKVLVGVGVDETENDISGDVVEDN